MGDSGTGKTATFSFISVYDRTVYVTKGFWLLIMQVSNMNIEAYDLESLRESSPTRV